MCYLFQEEQVKKYINDLLFFILNTLKPKSKYYRMNIVTGPPDGRQKSGLSPSVLCLSPSPIQPCSDRDATRSFSTVPQSEQSVQLRSVLSRLMPTSRTLLTSGNSLCSSLPCFYLQTREKC